MSLIKIKKAITKTKNAEVKIRPLPARENLSTKMIEYEIEIKSNMEELINEAVNEIEIVTNTIPLSSNRKKDQSNLSNIIEKNRKSSSTSSPRKIKSIDPKTDVAHGNLGKSSIEKIKVEVERETVTFSESRFKPIPRQDMDYAEATSSSAKYDAAKTDVIQKDGLLAGIQSQNSIIASRNKMSPSIKSIVKKTIPKKTIISSRVIVPRNETVGVNLKNVNGKIVGKVGKSADNIDKSILFTTSPKYLPIFNILAIKKSMFNIAISDDSTGLHLHVNSIYGKIIAEFEIFVRILSAAPEKDRYKSLGMHTNTSARNISLGVFAECNLLIHVIPKIYGKNLCWSQTHTHSGINIPTTANINSYQISRGKQSIDTLTFKIYNYPRNAQKMYAIRENLMTGEKTTLPAISTPIAAVSGVYAKSVEYVDVGLPLVNSTYRHDFFTIDKWGLESFVGNKVSRVFEKDTSGIIFRQATANRDSNNMYHEINFSIYIPDLWIPGTSDDLVDPGESVFEACRQQKKIGVLQLTRHSSSESPQIIDTFIINPSKSISSIPTELTDEQAVTGKFVIDPSFSKRFGLSSQKVGVDYYYELRAGYYLLSNELSFLKYPVKLTIPNQHTKGKTGYSYHPYLYDSPLSKDFGIIPKLGTSKNHMKIESLTSVAVLLEYEDNRRPNSTSLTLKARLGATTPRKVQDRPLVYAVIESNIPADVLKTCDHVELLYANSSNGAWTSLGKHKLSNGKFYYIDTIAPTLAANKIKYALIGRNYSMVRIFNVASPELDIKPYNYTERLLKDSNKLSIDKIKNSKLR